MPIIAIALTRNSTSVSWASKRDKSSRDPSVTALAARQIEAVDSSLSAPIRFTVSTDPNRLKFSTDPIRLALEELPSRLVRLPSRLVGLPSRLADLLPALRLRPRLFLRPTKGDPPSCLITPTRDRKTPDIMHVRSAEEFSWFCAAAVRGRARASGLRGRPRTLLMAEQR